MNITIDNETYWGAPTNKPAGWNSGGVILESLAPYDWINKWDADQWMVSKTDFVDEEVEALFAAPVAAKEPVQKKTKTSATVGRDVEKAIEAAANTQRPATSLPPRVEEWMAYIETQKEKGLIGLVPRPFSVESVVSFYNWDCKQRGGLLK